MHGQWLAQKTPSNVAAMAKRPVRSGNNQKSISLPVHIWEMLDQIAELQSAAYKEMGGKSKYSVSDLVEDGVTMYLQSLVEEFGDLPEGAEATRQFVKKLAEANRKSLHEQIFGKKS